MPESTLPLHIVTDLHIALSTEQGHAQAHLHGDSDGLVLDIDHPEAFLSQAAGRNRRRRLPPPIRAAVGAAVAVLTTADLIRRRLRGSGV